MNIQGKLSITIYAIVFFLAEIIKEEDLVISIIMLVMLITAAILALWSGKMYEKEENSISDEELEMLDELIRRRKEEIKKKD